VNVDDINYFYSQSANERVPCDALPDIDLKAWAEPAPAPAAHPYVEAREAAAALLPVATKTARSAVERFVDEVAPAAARGRTPVFRQHGRH